MLSSHRKIEEILFAETSLQLFNQLTFLVCYKNCRFIYLINVTLISFRLFQYIILFNSEVFFSFQLKIIF
jgi:hypothetical protein